jgi:carbon monoxide dehydrogenase subunit G
MKLEQSFEVAAPIERVWQTLIDVEHVAPCLPGAAVTGRNDDGSYNGTFTIKIGPTTASYTGKLEMEQVDAGSHTATMQAQGSDKRGQGGAKATIVSRLTPAGEGSTRVEVDTDYHITGRLARFGRGGMIEDISERLLREFATRLQASLLAQGERDGSAEPAAAPDGAQDSEAAPSPPEASGQAVEATATAATKPHATVAAPPPSQQPAPSAQTEPLTNEPIEGLSLVGSVMMDRVKRNPAPLLGLLGALLLLVLLRRRR